VAENFPQRMEIFAKISHIGVWKKEVRYVESASVPQKFDHTNATSVSQKNVFFILCLKTEMAMMALFVQIVFLKESKTESEQHCILAKCSAVFVYRFRFVGGLWLRRFLCQKLWLN
jgi:hypothetical protein